jgi:phosphoribosylanthranilate isomerase
MWLKICGMTSPEGLSAALDAQVDAIGFVFAPSPRELQPQQAAQLAAPARGRALCIAVTQHPSQALIEQILAEFTPDVLQTDLDDLAGLRLPASLSVLPVVRGALAKERAVPQRLLFEGPRSGSGGPADWRQAMLLARATQLILAGGLTAANVAAAIQTVRPFGVDVSSGVESSPGRKSPQRIVEFVQAARAACAGIDHERDGKTR